MVHVSCYFNELPRFIERKKEMKTISYETGRIYDGPQVLQITEAVNGWTFTDESRHMGEMFVSDDLFFDGDDVGAFILRSYDAGDYR